MRPDDFSRIEAIFAELVDLEPAARADALAAACPDRPDLRAEVDALLAAHDRIGDADDALDASADADQIGAGTQLGAFRLIEKIGEGGMGAVFRAERADGAFTQEVAAKVMRSAIVDADSKHRFKVERQILASLRHPNIVTLLDGGTTSAGLAYLVMEFVDGTDIIRHCRERSLPLGERLQLFRTLCTAVQFAHQRGIVHRDLKPGNILIGSDGVLKVLDFGVAKLLIESSDGAATRQGMLPGPLTPNYASPEQLRGLPVTTAADVYALGIVLYELVSGVRPYETSGLTLDRVLDVVVHTEPPRPSTAQATAARRHRRDRDEGDEQGCGPAVRFGRRAGRRRRPVSLRRAGARPRSVGLVCPAAAGRTQQNSRRGERAGAAGGRDNVGRGVVAATGRAAGAGAGRAAVSRGPAAGQRPDLQGPRRRGAAGWIDASPPDNCRRGARLPGAIGTRVRIE